jgi:hypothetical protein
MGLPQLLKDIRACTHCADDLPCAPRPVLQIGGSAHLRIISQAPGRRENETGIPWDDKIQPTFTPMARPHTGALLRRTKSRNYPYWVLLSGKG